MNKHLHSVVLTEQVVRVLERRVFPSSENIGKDHFLKIFEIEHCLHPCSLACSLLLPVLCVCSRRLTHMKTLMSDGKRGKQQKDR